MADNRFRDDGNSSLIPYGGKPIRVSGNHAQKTHHRNDTSRETNWFGYRLHVKNPARLHVLRVEYPDNEARQFVVSLIAQNTTGKARNFMDVGISSNGSEKGGVKFAQKDILFWPSTRDLSVAVVNALEGATAAVSNIKLFELNEITASDPAPRRSDRMRGVYLEDPHIDRMFRATPGQETDPYLGNAWRTDWVTWYQAFSRLLEITAAKGYDSLLFPAYTYGASFYPSNILENNGRYDTGDHFWDNRNPQQKDLFALLLRLAAQRQITVIPYFAFYTKIDELENVSLDAEGEHMAVDMINIDGIPARSYFKLRDEAKVGPYYDPLHPAVQATVRDVIKEFSTRYADSPAMGDIAIQINTSSWMIYPGISWGYSRDVVDRFIEGEKLNLPSNSADESALRTRNKWLRSDEVRSKWTAWRNRSLADFYETLGHIITENAPGRRLVLSFVNIFNSRYAETKGYLAKKKGMSVRDLLADKGLEPSMLMTKKDLRIWRPLSTPAPHDARGWNRSSITREAETMDIFDQMGSDGVVEMLSYYETKVAGMEKKWWYPLDYRMVATIQDPERPLPLKDRELVWFVGGWQVPQ